MITHIPTDPSKDYAVMKVLAQLRRTAGAGQVRRLTSGLDLSRMKPGEVLYIAGHGVMGSWQMSGISVSGLLSILNHERTGLPIDAGGVCILTCFSGMQKPSGSVADHVARGLKHKHIRVTGMCGFAYGSPQTEARGTASVLPEEFGAPYSQGANSIHTMLRGLTAPRAMRIAGRRIRRGQRVSDVVPDADLRHWSQDFARKRDELERRMKQVVAECARRSVAGSLSQPSHSPAARSVDALHSNREFQDLVRRQYNLHEDAGFFLARNKSTYTT